MYSKGLNSRQFQQVWCLYGSHELASINFTWREFLTGEETSGTPVVAAAAFKATDEQTDRQMDIAVA